MSRWVVVVGFSDGQVREAAVLIAAARAGSSSALDALLAEYRPYLLRIAASEMPRDLAGKVGASDIAQETLMQAAAHFGSFAGESEAELLGWLRRILLNQLLNTVRHYRTTKRDAGQEQPLNGQHLPYAADRSPSSLALANEERLLVELAVAQLPERQRRAIELRHAHDLSFAEIGKHLNCSEDAARKLWARAVDALQNQLAVHE